MKDDEALYAQAGIELVNNPNQGLLVKCTTQFPNDPNQAKAEYVKVRVKQMKEDQALELERKKREKKKRKRKERDQRIKEEDEKRDNLFKRDFSQEKLAESKKVLSDSDKWWHVFIRDNDLFGWLVFGMGVSWFLFSGRTLHIYFPDWWDWVKLGIVFGGPCLIWLAGLIIYECISATYSSAKIYVETSKKLGMDKSTEAPKQLTVKDD